MTKAIEIGTQVQINGRKATIISFTGAKRWDLKMRDDVRGGEFIASSKQLGMK
ncbi:hypothetical protein [Labrys sp. ZIDIC5]|uniref:hypothetical protein n=1 Tax=Labrys sedimenti TaxID=3106036 RepID=UPI002ACAAA2B|nr:hypothetical protein [Labrys sp. ZIDIC5]MDZ5448265.1 hypothetical protein [Labrys sp. ZIDIC5]